MKRHQFIRDVPHQLCGAVRLRLREKRVIDLAQEQGAAVLAIKALSGGYWKPDEEKPETGGINRWRTLSMTLALSMPCPSRA